MAPPYGELAARLSIYPNRMKTMMIKYIKKPLVWVALVAVLSAYTPVRDKFTAAETQQISIETPGLFSRSKAFSVDFAALKASEYSFPLPVGKARLTDNAAQLEITSVKGDAVKAMFDGEVRLSRNMGTRGNVVVIRHRNGLETVYENNAQNLVKVGQSVQAGQTIAIVGMRDGRAVCTFSVMVNGARINPTTLVDAGSHRLYRQTLVFEKRGSHIQVSNLGGGSGKERGLTLDPDEVGDPFENSSTYKLDLTLIEESHWAYPLPGAKVISPYGGRRRHSGVDLKTKPKDNVLAAFDGVVTRSSPYSGYGNCIVIRHAYGFETLYSHQHKNLVKVGDKVRAGQVIGLTGRTGRATTEHLHFEIKFRGTRLNPAVIFDHGKRGLQQTTLTLTKGGGIRSSK